MLGRYVGRRIDREGPPSVFAPSQSELKAADFTVGNLECVLTRRAATANKQIRLTANPEMATALARAGFDGMALANNHALDCGRKGLSDTVIALSKAGILSFGLAGEIQRVTLKGIRLSFLSYTDFPEAPGAPIASSLVEDSLLVSNIRKARREADVVVVLWHWGTELSAKANDRQGSLAALAAKAGADVILGSHPHVLQPVEWVKGANGRRCLVAYSLGNFIFDSRPGAERKTGILHVALDKSGAKAFRLAPYEIDRGAPVRAVESMPSVSRNAADPLLLATN